MRVHELWGSGFGSGLFLLDIFEFQPAQAILSPLPTLCVKNRQRAVRVSPTRLVYDFFLLLSHCTVLFTSHRDWVYSYVKNVSNLLFSNLNSMCVMQCHLKTPAAWASCSYTAPYSFGGTFIFRLNSIFQIQPWRMLKKKQTSNVNGELATHSWKPQNKIRSILNNLVSNVRHVTVQ